MTKLELKALNTELVALLTGMRDQIDDTLEQLAAVDDPDADEILQTDDDADEGD